jgi:hypothetical protein
MARAMGDPALFVHVAGALLATEDDEVLAHEAYSTAQRVSAALPSEEMRRIFEAAEPVQQIARAIG